MTLINRTYVYSSRQAASNAAAPDDNTVATTGGRAEKGVGEIAVAVGATGASVSTALIGDHTSSSKIAPAIVGNNSKPTVMHRMGQQLSHAFGKRSFPATAALVMDDGSTGSNLFAIADPPNRFAAARAPITELPRSLSHNDDF